MALSKRRASERDREQTVRLRISNQLFSVFLGLTGQGGDALRREARVPSPEQWWAAISAWVREGPQWLAADRRSQHRFRRPSVAAQQLGRPRAPIPGPPRGSWAIGPSKSWWRSKNHGLLRGRGPPSCAMRAWRLRLRPVIWSLAARVAHHCLQQGSRAGLSALCALEADLAGRLPASQRSHRRTFNQIGQGRSPLKVTACPG